MKLDGRIIVVTGAGSGMGRQVALEAVRRGARVAAVDLNEATLGETADLVGSPDRMSTHVLNITDRAAVQALPQAVIDRFGAVDGLVHCAGIIQPFVRFKDLDDDAIERVFAVNWWGTVWLTKAFLPILLGRPEGHIVNTSSMGGFLPVPGQTIYGASKAAVKLFTEGLNSECAGTNLHVTVVFPGAVATNITTNSGVDIPISGEAAETAARRTLPADKAARIILDGMERNAFRVMVGSDAKLMDRLYRLDPRRAAGFIAGRMKNLLPR
ncbi:MAG TPA: SDR family oxidoreductase [Candidatus Deferrimicrobium sp.]|nr:SDR family oxidoreductase [Candidatus Deferrimicrobium sp.]